MKEIKINLIKKFFFKNLKFILFFFVEPMPHNPRHNDRRGTVTSITSDIYKYIVTKPSWIVHWYVVYVRHLNQKKTFTISVF